MAAESFSAAGDSSGTAEPLVSTSVHWGTAQLGAPPRDQPAPWPQTADPSAELTADPSAPPAAPPGPPAAPSVPPVPTADPSVGREIELGTDAASPSPSPEGTVYDVEDEHPVQVVPDDDEGAVSELIRVAVVSRPLDDVVDLVTLLEQSPSGMPTAASVLRLAAVARSVDDVTRLVELLGPPEHPAEHMDQAIRHAAAKRPIPEVSRLVHLLSRPPHDPRSGDEVVHAAGTTRSVTELMELIGSLKKHRAADAEADAAAEALAAETGTPVAAPKPAGAAARTSPDRAADAAPEAVRDGTRLVWLRRVAGVLLLLCAAAHLPLHWSDAPAFGLPAAIAVCAVCAAAGVALCLSRSPVVAVVSTLVAGGLALGHLVDDRVDSTTLAYVLRPDGVTAPLPALSAVVAALASLLVVAFTLAALRAGRYPAQRR
ncbi:hypothetical protein [Streptomyces sp. NPDC029674]|uniref:hypothetical protein n=1 Tax=Streptomyces sp. NPDC029674 TaxID=3365297 RepID=UPI00384C9FD9